MEQQARETLAEMRDVLVETYAVNDAMNQLLLAHLAPRAWRAHLPKHPTDEGLSARTPSRAKPKGGRTIASIFAHLHNSRLVWLKNSAPHLKSPAPLDPFRCTMKQAATALTRSAGQCLRMLTDALSANQDRRVRKFSRGSWTRTWPAGAAMFAYMFSHEAHHRGQVIMLAHELGYRLPASAWGGIWQWDRLWKERGFTTRPR